jgi:hypothetical protein
MKKAVGDYMQKLSKPRQQQIRARAAEIMAEEMSLQELRKAERKSRQELANRPHVKQAEISKREA